VLLRRARFRFLLVLPDDCRACGFPAGFLVSDRGRGSMAGFLVSDHGRGSMAEFFMVVHRKGRGSMTVATVGEDDDFVRPVVTVPRRRRPPRRSDRTVFGSCPEPFIPDIEPAFVIRDVLILVENVAVFRDVDFLRAGHDDCPRRGRDDFLRACDDDRFFHDDRLLDDRGRRFHDDRSRTGFDDRADQVHDVGRKPDAVGRWFVMIPGESGGRSEDDRRSESSADSDCLFDGLLSSVSFWKRGLVFSPRTGLFLVS